MSGRNITVFILIGLLGTGCMEERVKQAWEMTEWKTMDSIFQYNIPQPGSEKFSKGDSFKVSISAVLDSNGATPIDTAYVDKGCLRFAELWTKSMLVTNVSGIVKKSEEGILRADFSIVDWRKDFLMQAYLKKSVKKDQVDTLLKKLTRMPEVQSVHFISAEEAKKRWLAAGETDFIEFLDENPLPASIELHIEPDYLKEIVMKEFADGLKEKFPIEIYDIKYPVDFIRVMECFRKYIFLITYKT